MCQREEEQLMGAPVLQPPLFIETGVLVEDHKRGSDRGTGGSLLRHDICGACTARQFVAEHHHVLCDRILVFDDGQPMSATSNDCWIALCVDWQLG